ncbi:MAG: SusC/RagA family TonB-linked outer membrane protein, partial [Bacteroidales bacterium]|nr:SusC/RagA family TonB-linked outer membrane protein [Bacteroidales bacterium]
MLEAKTSAQETRISLSLKDVPLKKALMDIEHQTQYLFFNKDVDYSRNVSIEIKNATTEEVCNALLTPLGIAYEIQKSNIVIFMAPKTKASSQSGGAKIRVQGRVTDAKGEPLAGASVLWNNGKDGVVTDIDGNYDVEVPEGTRLEFSYIGFTPLTMPADNSGEMNIVLKEDINILNEVVVIGYGTMDKKELTSAITHVGEKNFLSISAADPAALIKGKVSGVSIVNTGSADPNSMSSIQVRGVNSRQAGLGPLIVIDGIPGGSLQNVNPADIASFDILKDGAASAIYGTRGSNGVILVTTKSGAKDGSVHASYSASVSWDTLIRELDMMTADEYRDVRMGWGDNATDLGGNYDWLKGVSRTGFSHKHTVGLSGGTERTNYRVSVDYRYANGIDLRSDRREYGGRASVNHKTKGGLMEFNVNFAPRVVYSNNADWSVFSKALDANPTTPLMNPLNPSKYYDFLGQIAGSNPVEYQLLEKDKTDTRMLDWDATARLNLLPLLADNPNLPITLNTQVTYSDRQYSYDSSIFKPSSTTGSINAGRTGSAVRKYDLNRQENVEWLTNFTGSFGRNNVKLLLGYSYSYYQNSGFSAENQDFANDAVGADNLGTGEFMAKEGEVGMSSYRNSSKLISFFGRVSYDWDGKYLMTASLRREGSSKFGANHKWGNFPAVSAGWRISRESFMEGTRGWLDELKLRADYGVTGNQEFAS